MFLLNLKDRTLVYPYESLPGISHSYLNNIEKGYSLKTGKPVSPTIETCEKIASGSGMSLQKLLEQAGYIVETITSDNNTNHSGGHEILAAHRTNGYDEPLPQEALDELEKFKAYLRHKYRHWKPGMTQGEYLKKYGGDGEGGE